MVDGTTTTLDTVVTEVDRLEVGANNNTVGVAITQSGVVMSFLWVVIQSIKEV